jgi:hypothetical protein
VATELPRLSDPTDLSQDDTGHVLGWLHRQYPAFRFLCGPVGWHSQRWTAERIDGLDPGLHTLITADLRELCSALDADRARRTW